MSMEVERQHLPFCRLCQTVIAPPQQLQWFRAHGRRQRWIGACKACARIAWRDATKLEPFQWENDMISQYQYKDQWTEFLQELERMESVQ